MCLDPCDAATRLGPRKTRLQAAFLHNGAFTRLEDAIYHHLHVFQSARNYDPTRAGVDKDLTLLWSAKIPSDVRRPPFPADSRDAIRQGPALM